MSEDGSSVTDGLEDLRCRPPEEEILAAMEIERMKELLERLDQRESKILKLRFGLEEGEPMTLKAIGKRFGLTRERVRQMEQQALDKLCAIMSREFGEECDRRERQAAHKKRVTR